MAKKELIFSVPINEKIEKALEDGYKEYLAKAEDPVLTVEEYNLHILKIGILSNNIKKAEINYNLKKDEASKFKSKMASLKRECTENRKKIKTAYDYEYY